MGIPEIESCGRQTVEDGRLDELIAIRANGVRPLVIGKKEKNVGTFRRGLGLTGAQQNQQRKGDEQAGHDEARRLDDAPWYLHRINNANPQRNAFPTVGSNHRSNPPSTHPSDMHTLQVQGVTKQYEKVLAVNNVSFEAQPGRILGLLGPNGAGKTTTIRMITYITIPDTGQILFGSEKVGPKSQEIMGYLPEERGLYKKMKVGEQLLYFAELKGMPKAEAKESIKYWLDRMGALDWVSKETNELSKGMQQKIQFIATILHDPKLLILDEPFGGLDPINSDLLQDVILELKDSGRTIVFASHRMEQVEQLCDDICLVSKGEIVVNGPLSDVKKRYGKNTVMINFEGSDAFLDPLESSGAIRVNARSTRHAEIRLLNGTPSKQVLTAALEHVSDITRFELVEPPMREIFVTAVTEQQGRQALEPVQSTGGAA